MASFVPGFGLRPTAGYLVHALALPRDSATSADLRVPMPSTITRMCNILTGEPDFHLQTAAGEFSGDTPRQDSVVERGAKARAPE